MWNTNAGFPLTLFPNFLENLEKEFKENPKKEKKKMALILGYVWYLFDKKY